MKPEAGLWDFLRPRLPIGTHHSRVESPDTAPGFPDVHWTLRKHTGTFELKCQPFPSGEFPFRGEKHGLRKAQKIWIRDELEAGGTVILVLQYREEIHFLIGQHAKSLDGMNIDAIRHHAALTWDRGGEINPEDLAHLMVTKY